LSILASLLRMGGFSLFNFDFLRANAHYGPRGDLPSEAKPLFPTVCGRPRRLGVCARRPVTVFPALMTDPDALLDSGAPRCTPA
jgi:hypothetical protein